MNALAAFLVHLRWHYQVLVLPAGYLLGGLYREAIDWRSFAAQFLTVHLLLNGGVTAYNSCHDRDEGPIGGLERPPPTAPWMIPASIALQLLGLAIAILLGAGFLFAALWATTMILSIAYSRRPRPRWKGHPWLALVAVGIGTGTNTFLMGFLSAGADSAGAGNVIAAAGISRAAAGIYGAAAGISSVGAGIFSAAAGVALLLLSIYPISQIFQIDTDRARGDRTFATEYGLRGVRTFFFLAYPTGALIVTATLPEARAFAITAFLGFLIVGWQLLRLRGEASEYRRVMRLKYLASLTFTAFVTLSLVLRSRA